MASTSTITVKGYKIRVEYNDYICLTDMAKADGNESRAADVIKNWLNTKSTIDFLGTWEQIYNPLFKVVEFHHFIQEVGRQSFNVSIDSWVEKTEATGIYSRKGRNGGTFAHKDIAFEFGAAISPAFKLYLIKEYQRLKEQENRSLDLEWNLRRMVAKGKWTIQTDAVRDYKIPFLGIPQQLQSYAYAEEGDIINTVLFGFTAKQWRENNVALAGKGKNVRDFASVKELMVLESLEVINSELMRENVCYADRLSKLNEIKKRHMKSLEKLDPEKSFKRTVDGTFKPFFQNKDNRLGMFPENPDHTN